MAAMIQSQPAAQDVSAARAFWQSKMSEHPNVAGLLAIMGEVAGWFLNGHFLVWLGQWIIRVSGYIAETALLFAVLWISGTSVAPHLVELVMSEQTMQYFVSVALVALALIPEIILANAIVNALGHVQTATQQRTLVAWIWAILFTLPTVLFLGLTAYTLNSLVANGGNFVQASAGLVGLRCFAGWTYGLLEMVYAGIGRKMVNQAQPVITPAQPVAPVQQQPNGEIAELREQITALGEQITALLAARNEPVEETVSIDEPIEYSIETPGLHLVQSVSNDVPVAPLTMETKNETTKPVETAQERAARILKKHPNLTAAELATKAKITPQYAGKLLKKQANG